VPSFRIASYNVLADAYLRPEWFRHVAPERLDPAWRDPALVRRILALDADVACLQEVEEGRYARLAAAFEAYGYAGRFGQKGRRRPDGCATFVRTSRVSVLETRAHHFRDGVERELSSGHLALITRLAIDGAPVSVANTHLRFDPPARRGLDHIGVRQAHELADEMLATDDARVVCGDLNDDPASDVVRTFLERDFADAYAVRSSDYTCNIKGRARRIDFILTGPAFATEPVPLSPLSDTAPMPAADEPSDHRPIAATLYCPTNASRRSAPN